jgi:hypothetical protein
MRGYYTPNETEGKYMAAMTHELLGWCENDECGEPIYEGTKHVEQVSDVGSRYFYCASCAIKPTTPDEKKEEN